MSTDTVADAGAQDDHIRLLVKRLARPHPSGGRVVERASLLAAGADFRAAIAWIEAHDGTPEAPVAPSRAGRGLHAGRGDAGRPTAPARFVLPADALR